MHLICAASVLILVYASWFRSKCQSSVIDASICGSVTILQVFVGYRNIHNIMNKNVDASEEDGDAATNLTKAMLISFHAHCLNHLISMAYV